MTNRPLVELGILGLLNEWDQLSIDTIQDRLQHNFGSFWTFSYGALLPVVSELEEKGHVQPGADDGDAFRGAEGSHPYEITEEGRNRLEDLLRQPLADVKDPQQRHKVIIKLGFIHHLPPEERTAEFDHLIDRFVTFRREWQEIRDEHDSTTMAEFDGHGYRVELIDLSIEMIDTLIDWLERHRERTLETMQ